MALPPAGWLLFLFADLRWAMAFVRFEPFQPTNGCPILIENSYSAFALIAVSHGNPDHARQSCNEYPALCD